MELAEFIESHHDEILADWVAFARTLLPWAKGMTDVDLRDHAADLLTAVVVDMNTPQSDRQQAEKSKGRARESALGRIGHKHAAERLSSGFELDQLVAEYRALRASVLRRWGRAHDDEQSEMTRFNEAIDETLGEAALWYSDELNQTRAQFLAILGHDLRNPLGAILMGAEVLSNCSSLNDRQARTASRIATSAGRMSRMINDLLDLTRTRLGTGIPVQQAPMDLVPICEHVVAELEAIHPQRELRLAAPATLKGEWDGDRLTQVISNLVANALQHGGADGPVTLVADEDGDGVVVRVHNTGEPIPPDVLPRVFEPMIRRHAPGSAGNRGGLGLGLHIAREVVAAHGGSIDVESSSAAGTTFTIRLPRRRATVGPENQLRLE